jgi:hypothetical protein
MLFSYGQGQFKSGAKVFQGQIFVDDIKLFLQGPQGPLPPTFVVLDKIKIIRQGFSGVEIFIQLSSLESYTVQLKGTRKFLADLVRDLAEKRLLKKKFWRREWVDEAAP